MAISKTNIFFLLKKVFSSTGTEFPACQIDVEKWFELIASICFDSFHMKYNFTPVKDNPIEKKIYQDILTHTQSTYKKYFLLDSVL